MTSLNAILLVLLILLPVLTTTHADASLTADGLTTTSTGTSTPQKVLFPPFSDPSTYCPSFCDPQGSQHRSKSCIVGEFCCEMSNYRLDCCLNTSLKINTTVVVENYNCERFASTWINKYWKVILGICLPVGMLSLVASLLLCGYQTVRNRRLQVRRRQAAIRQRSESGLSECSSCSSTSSSVRAGQVLPQVVEVDDVNNPVRGLSLTPSYTPAVSLSVHDLELNQPPPYSLHLAQPPPYSASLPDAPPPYSEIFTVSGC